MTELTNNQGESSDSTKAREEAFDAVRRHICQVLGFDCGFIDRVNNVEVSTAVTFSAEETGEDVTKVLESLVDEHKQSVTVANTLLAQKVLQTKSPLVSRLYSPEEVKASEESSDNPGVDADGIPYIIVPIFDNPNEGRAVRGLIRVLSFDASREMDSKDLSTLKLMGEHLANRVGIFGELQGDTVEPEGERDRFEFDSILVVHSDRLARRRFARILKQQFNVLEADTSEKALEMLEEDTRVDLILLDAALRGTSGLGFCKVLKDSNKWKQIPVVLVNADNTPAARVEGLNVGADDCIPDTCLEAELVARINSSLRHRRTERDLFVQLNLLEDYAGRLEIAQEQLKDDKQSKDQDYLKMQQMRQESEVHRNQDNLLHRISNIIRSSFDIEDNLKEMLEALAGWWTLDCCFIVMPSEDEPEDTIRVEYNTDKSYRVIDFDKDLETLRIFRENFEADEAVIANDVANDRKLVPFRKSAIAGFQVKSLFYVPINYEKKLLGLLIGYKCEMKANWSRINENFMRSVADQVANGVVNARLYAKVQRQATTDGLTGLYNHRTGQEKLAEQFKLAERYSRNISAIMLDIDHFKSINDNYGHPAGDSVIKAVSRLIKKNCRDVDIPVRYGGEEFLIVLPEITREGASVVAERIRTALEQEIVNHEDIKINVTGSFGVSSFPIDAESQQTLLDLADKALYMSKRVSRNRVSTVADLNFDKEEKEDNRSTEEIASEIKAQEEADEFTAPDISEEAKQTDELVPEVVEMVKTLATSLYAKSDYNKQHHLEVARMSELLAKVMGLSAQQVEQIRVAGLLHDVGLLKLPKTVIEKEGALSNEEREIVNQHPVLGAQLLKPVRALRDICEILEHHHERWDGTGFPSGMKGEEIPLPARIVAIVDSYHAMISERPYREAMTHEEALLALQNGAGRQWDPFLVQIFSAVVKSMKDGSDKNSMVAAMSEAAKNAASSQDDQKTVPQEESKPQAPPEQAQPPQPPQQQAAPEQAQPPQPPQQQAAPEQAPSPQQAQQQAAPEQAPSPQQAQQQAAPEQAPSPQQAQQQAAPEQAPSPQQAQQQAPPEQAQPPQPPQQQAAPEQTQPPQPPQQQAVPEQTQPPQPPQQQAAPEQAQPPQPPQQQAAPEQTQPPQQAPQQAPPGQRPTAPPPPPPPVAPPLPGIATNPVPEQVSPQMPPVPGESAPLPSQQPQPPAPPPMPQSALKQTGERMSVRPPLPPSISQKVQGGSHRSSKQYEQFSSQEDIASAQPSQSGSQFPLHTQEVDNPLNKEQSPDSHQEPNQNPYDDVEEENVEF